MLFYFDDIMTPVENKCNVIIICCRYPIFSNMIIDRCSKYCKGKIDVNISEYKEFLFGSSDENTEEGFLDFETFRNYVAGRKAIGKWYSRLEYDILNKNQINSLYEYLKYPSDNGLLVITVRDWKNIKKILDNSYYKTHSKIGVYNIGFPSKRTLSKVIEDIFKQHNIEIDKAAINLFITRMGNNYNAYSEELERIMEDNGGGKVTYKQMLSYMSGIYNYAVDDYLEGIVKPIEKDKVVISRKSYKVLKSLLNEYTALQVVSRIKRRIRQMIEYRLYINKGIIPVEGAYDVKKIQASLPEDSQIKSVSSIYFRQSAEIAKKTTLKDWCLVLVMLTSANDEKSAFRILLSVANRSVYNTDRLLNNLKIKDVIKEELVTLNVCKPLES